MWEKVFLLLKIFRERMTGESNMQIASKLPSDAVILFVHETCKGIFEKYQGKLQNSIIERSMAISK